MASVVCAGVVTADLVFRVPEPVDAPKKYRANQSVLTSGGCALNAAAAVARLGGAAHLAGSVGADLFGDVVRDEIAAEGVATGLLVRAEGVPTARSAVLVGPGGERTIVNHQSTRDYSTGPTAAASHSRSTRRLQTPAGRAAPSRSWSRPARLAGRACSTPRARSPRPPAR